jgi:hypothetical protein
MALDHKTSSKHIEKALTKGHIVKPLKERTPEDVAAAKANKNAAKKAPAKKKASK